MVEVPDERLSRLKLIENLHKEGLKDKQISDYLNDKGILTPRGKKYYYELVSVTRKKFTRRTSRNHERKVELIKLDIYF